MSLGAQLTFPQYTDLLIPYDVTFTVMSAVRILHDAHHKRRAFLDVTADTARDLNTVFVQC